MGYNTSFEGAFVLSRQLTLDENETLREIASDVYAEDATGAPSGYCQWVPVARGSRLEWDGGEKFYDYVEWLRYLIDKFFGPWGVCVTGEVAWAGEDSSDRGMIRVHLNKLIVSSVVETPCKRCDGKGFTEEYSAKGDK